MAEPNDQRAELLREQTSPTVGSHRPELQDFDDDRGRWYRLAAEVVGTFLLVCAAAGGGLAAAGGSIGQAAAVTAPGLTVMAVILAIGAISGAHLNPTVTLAFAIRGDFAWYRVPGYLLAQIVGGVLAALLLAWLFPGGVGPGGTYPGHGFHAWNAAVLETLLTFGLVTVILGAAWGAQNLGALSALAAGGYVALAGLWASPFSGASMNPVRSLGPALVAGDWTSWWVYLVGPFAGSLLAVGVSILLRGRTIRPAAELAATGSGA